MADLIKKFNEHVKAQRFTKAYKPDTFKIKPSMIGTRCLRKAFYACTEVPEDYPMPLNVQRICKMGDAVGDMLTAEFRKMGVLVDYYNKDGSVPQMFGRENREFPIHDPDIYIKRGYIDGVFVLDGKLWLGEFKSINSNGYKYLNGPKMEHYCQGLLYLYVFNKLMEKNEFEHIRELAPFKKAEGIIFLYVNKDTSTMKQFSVTKDDAFFTQIVNKIITLKHYKDTNTLPPWTEDWCNSCNWRDKCAGNKIR
jgi:hypothetical protein